jgi:hypothetical protein
MKYYLVIRDKKNKNLDVKEYPTMKKASAVKEAMVKSGHQGQLVIGYGSSMNDFLTSFTEYRPKNWKDLIK